LVVGKQFDWVNPKQAQRILIVRAKRAAKVLKRIQQAAATNTILNANVVTTRFTKPRVKDSVRRKVALERVRDQGLFVSKKKEQQLKRTVPVRKGLAGSDSETDDPD
jgi:hypothetical protein